MMQERPVIVHNLEQARLAASVAAELGVPLVLLSPPGAAGYLGAQVFREIGEQAAACYDGLSLTVILDCDGEPGLVLNALRHGLRRVVYAGPEDVHMRLADIAARCGAEVLTGPLPALDLPAEADPEGACRAWLAPGRAAATHPDG